MRVAKPMLTKVDVVEAGSKAEAAKKLAESPDPVEYLEDESIKELDAEGGWKKSFLGHWPAQYSSGSSSVVVERSHSVMIQSFPSRRVR
jgi:hypothetical protein